MVEAYKNIKERQSHRRGAETSLEAESRDEAESRNEMTEETWTGENRRAEARRESYRNMSSPISRTNSTIGSSIKI